MSANSKCCCCIHVKTGTSVWSGFLLTVGLLSTVYFTLLLSNAIQPDEYDYFAYEYNNRSAFWIGLGNSLFVVMIGGMAVYGLAKNRGGYLIPLFIAMLFDVLCTIISIGSLMFYWPNVKLHIAECKHMPVEWKEWLLSIDDRWLACMVFSFLFLVLVLKSYLSSMVYRCYQYISAKVVLRQRRDPEITVVADMDVSDKKPVYKLPNYSDIQKVPLVDDVDEVYDTKPPAYSA